MWDHVTLRAADLDASARFNDTVLRTLGIEREYTAEWLVDWGQFSLSPANAEKPVTRGLHIGFSASTREHVHALWQAGVDAGYRDDGEPGLRPEYGPDYYGGFLLDPDGNSAEAVHHDLVADRDAIDHIWIRVADVAAARRSTWRSRRTRAPSSPTTRPSACGSRLVLGGRRAADRAPAHGVPGARPRGRRRVPPRRRGGGLPRQRRAGRAARVPRGLLRRVRLRSRRQQRRAGVPRSRLAVREAGTYIYVTPKDGGTTMAQTKADRQAAAKKGAATRERNRVREESSARGTKSAASRQGNEAAASAAQAKRAAKGAVGGLKSAARAAGDAVKSAGKSASTRSKTK